MSLPDIDPTPIFEHFRGSYGSELLTAAVAHFDIFGKLADRPMSLETLGERLNLARRPLVVLTTALRAMKLLRVNNENLLEPTELARTHLVVDAPLAVADYIGLAANSPGVLEMVTRLKSNTPAGADDEGGAAFIYRDGVASAMEEEEAARHFTLALAGRAKNVAPVLAGAVDASSWKVLVDVGGGTGIYAIEMVKRFPQLSAIVIDRPQVLKVADEFVREHNVSDWVELRAGDMFTGELPPDADAILLSNILHDWDEPECETLVKRCADALPTGGRVLIHDVFLNDELDGPLPIALYSAALFTLTEGRAYSAAEYRNFFAAAGLEPEPVVPTAIHCGVLAGVKK